MVNLILIFFLGLIIGIVVWIVWLSKVFYDLIVFWYDFQEYKENQKEFIEYLERIGKKKKKKGEDK